MIGKVYVHLSAGRNKASDDTALMTDSKALHVSTANTGNALSPSVEQHVVGTTSIL